MRTARRRFGVVHMQLAAPSRLRARTIIVIITALMLAFGTLAAPARAGADDGVE